MRISSFVLAAALPLSGVGCGEEASPSTRADEAPIDGTFPIGGEGSVECLNGQQIRIYEFSTAAERDSAAASLDPQDASRVDGASVAWSGNPIFWRSAERKLAMYAGVDVSVIDHLDDAFGARVSQGRGRSTDADAFDC
jgi:hypothetical protein